MKLQKTLYHYRNTIPKNFISAPYQSINYYAVRQGLHCRIFCDSLLKRYHQSINQAQNRDVNGRNFFDDDSELDPRSSEQIGDYLTRAINLVAYTAGPLHRLTVFEFANARAEMERLNRGLSR